jgi:tryptophan halogenase
MNVNNESPKTAISIGIVGSGTAGLLSALLLRKAFPFSDITIVSSSQIGIIGVGEGSTEHWKEFMRICDIPVEDVIIHTAATHKYGIRFEQWTQHTPDYFHSVGGTDDIYAFGLLASYMGFIEEGKLLTSQTSSIGLIRNQVNRANLHESTNQYHFDTFKLNDYLTGVCFSRRIKFIEGIVEKVNINSENGYLESVSTDRNENCSADFWIDASGFHRVLMKHVSNPKWNSFSDYLLCDSAIAFPTESDPNGQIRPYTRARAASSGWIWEIPTQERRGNGYVFSSKFINEEQALQEASRMTGYEIDKHRMITFDAGYLDECWAKNCCAVGLSSSFVEPLEATSIGSTIQQVKHLIPLLASFKPGNTASQKFYNKKFNMVMRNILTMIRLHYYSDRQDSKFWQEMKNMPVNDELQELIDIWSETPPSRFDFQSVNGELFATPHLAHVAQGQGLISKNACTIAIDNMALRQRIKNEIAEIRHNRHNHELIDHKKALMETSGIDKEWQ